MTFLEDDGTEIKVEAQLGATLLEVAHENDVELEGEFLGLLYCRCPSFYAEKFYLICAGGGPQEQCRVRR